MEKIKLIIIMQALLLALLYPQYASAGPEIVAHRGIFHDTDDSYALPENSYDAVVRAFNLQYPAVELDTRLTRDGQIMITHDFISNRTTTLDNLSGKMDPIAIAQGRQKPPFGINISEYDESVWSGTPLKVYGRNDKIFAHDGMMSLAEMFDNLTKYHPGMFDGSRNFSLIMDIQDPDIFAQLASYVSSHHLYTIVLKFFASKALYDDVDYVGDDTCYNYMKKHNLADPKLIIIPQINDGEIDVDENDNAGITKWGHHFGISEYLSCWADARLKHFDAAAMITVAASVPLDNDAATAGATEAIQWARNNGRLTMSTVPNPDVALRDSHGVCQPYSFQGENVAAKAFDINRRNAKNSFAYGQNVDYIIFDVMGEYSNLRSYFDYDNFMNNMC